MQHHGDSTKASAELSSWIWENFWTIVGSYDTDTASTPSALDGGTDMTLPLEDEPAFAAVADLPDIPEKPAASIETAQLLADAVDEHAPEPKRARVNLLFSAMGAERTGVNSVDAILPDPLHVPGLSTELVCFVGLGV